MNRFAKRRTWGPEPRYPFVEEYVPPSKEFVFIAGPCSVESKAQILTVAEMVSQNGATHLRGGVFRAGSYPGNNFGWVDRHLISYYHDVAIQFGLKNIIEVLDYRDLDWLNHHADCYQVGARSMQNYTLLRLVGLSGKPVFLKRHQGSTVDEWLGAAEHILKSGCKELYLIERGSSTYHNDVRWCPTIHTIMSVESITQLPVIYDASHSCGRRDMVQGNALAGVAAGASGVLIEVHPDPDNSLSDPDQAVSFIEYQLINQKIKALRGIL